MPLRHEPNVAHADWFVSSSAPWTQLCSLGPSGFARYCRLTHPLDGDSRESDDGELRHLEGHLDRTQLDQLTAILNRHTATGDDCFFGLWDGFGEIHGSPSASFVPIDGTTEAPVRPAFADEVLAGPRVVIPHRSYLLFRGPLGQAGQWGAADLAPGWPRTINSPNLMWPRDHAWFVATDVDLPWTGVAGSAALIDELLAHPCLDTQPVADPRSAGH